MAILQLDITENRPDGQAANERGELTDWQRERLVRQLNNPRQPRMSLLPDHLVSVGLAVVGSLIVMIGLILGSFVFSLRLLTVESIIILVVGVLAFIRIAFGNTINALQYRLRFFTRVGPHLRNARRMLTKDDYQIEGWNGPVRFIMFPPGTYRMFGMESFEDTYVIATSMHSFPVSKAMWESLRPHAENDFTLHYLTEPVPALLSIVHIPRSEPPTDAELSAVIGIGDDGELIYEEQGGKARHQL